MWSGVSDGKMYKFVLEMGYDGLDNRDKVIVLFTGCNNAKSDICCYGNEGMSQVYTVLCKQFFKP